MSLQTISEKVRDYEFLREQQADMKANLSALTERVDAAEAEVIRLILDQEEQTGVDGLRITVDNRNYSVSSKDYFSIPKAQRDTAYPLLRDLGHGDLIVERVDDRALTKELKEVMEDNGGVLPPGYEALGLTQYMKPALRNVKA